MPIYVSFLGHVELPNVDDRSPRQIPAFPVDGARVDRRPARRKRHGQDV